MDYQPSVKHHGDNARSWRVDHYAGWIPRHVPELRLLSFEGIAYLLFFTLSIALIIAGSYLPKCSFQVQGHSMNTTFYTKDVIIGIPYPSTVEKNDVVVFREPKEWGGDDNYVKRVMATAGDKVEINENGKISVNGSMVEGEEAYNQGCPAAIDDGRLSWTVPAGKIFVRGDNVNNSRDSRYVSCFEQRSPFVSMKNVELREVFSLKLGKLKHEFLLSIGKNDDVLALND